MEDKLQGIIFGRTDSKPGESRMYIATDERGNSVTVGSTASPDVTLNGREVEWPEWGNQRASTG